MSCAAHEPGLALLVSDDLDAGEAAALHAHLAACTDCRARLAGFRADALWLRQQRALTPEASLQTAFRARLSSSIKAEITARPPVSWPAAWLRRLGATIAGAGVQPVLAAVGAVLLVVGAIGALGRPLGPMTDSMTGAAMSGAAISGRDAVVAGFDRAPPKHRHTHDQLAFGDGDEDPSALDEGPPAHSEAAAEATATPGSLRIELQTRDPDVRIIWFAQADSAHSLSR